MPRSPYQRKMPAADEGVAFALSLSPPIRGMSGYGMVAASAKARDAKQSTGALTCSLLGRERASGHGKSYPPNRTDGGGPSLAGARRQNFESDSNFSGSICRQPGSCGGRLHHRIGTPRTALDWSIGLTAFGEVVGKPKTPGCITEVALFVPNDFPTLALEHPVWLALPGV